MKTAILARLVSGSLFVAVAAGVWDAWWHGVLGRESFWSPPHLLLYFATFIAIGGGIYGWKITKEKLWKRLAIALSAVPLSAPFDELWHQIFGIETPQTLLIFWSPPHLVLIGAIIAAFILILPILAKDEDVIAQRIFSSLSFAGILTLITFLISPFDPIGPYKIIGFPGAIFWAFAFALILLSARRKLPGLGVAFTVASFFVVLSSIGSSHNVINPASGIPPHAHPPAWLTVFSMITPAIVIDLMYKKVPFYLLGGITILMSCGLMYSIAPLFLEPEFQYDFTKTLIAIGSAILGGIGAGYLVGRAKNK